ncbi:MAG: Spi family protease inhibitor, partial [Bacteroidales bacterium]|nr:Spi family protease inhibitor [Bacteroidales bacterium]
MLNKIKHLALVLLLCVCTVSMALPVDVSKATKVANNFWKSNSETSKFSGDLVFTNLASTEGYSGFYIFKNAIGEGFVVVSADDCVIPVLAYSATGNLDESFLPENMKTMLSW